MSSIKRLSPPQSRKVNSLVRRECCNCDNGHCILLDDGDECVCPQLISYSLLCKWFRIAVLPLDKLLYAELFKTEDKKRCTVCGAFFAPEEQNRAFSDAVIRIKDESLKERNRTWDPTDIQGLQELVKAKKELEELGRKRQQLHISFE